MSTDPVVDELLRTEESARIAAATQFSAGKFWRGLNLVLGVPAAVAASLSGATGLAESTSDAPAILALAAAALTATLTILNAAQRATQSLTSANAYLSLETDVRVFRTVLCTDLDADERSRRLLEFVERRKTLNETAPVPAFLSYLLGNRNLQKGRQTYEVDRLPGQGDPSSK